MMENNERTGQWQWQQSGEAWRGVGIFHATLTVTSREPMLGRLVVPADDPAQARVERSELGQALLDCQRSLSVVHPEIQVLQYCLMPDHLHSIWYVRRPMEQSIRQVAQGFWRAAKKAGRAFSFLHGCLPGSPTDERPAPAAAPSADAPALPPALAAPFADVPALPPALAARFAGGGRPSLSSLAPADSRDNLLCSLLGTEAYYGLDPLFTEVPFLRPLSRRGQLQTMIRYVQLNPQRLAVKRLYPGFFRVQEGVVVAGRTYSAVGNAALLQAQRFAPVHVRRAMVDAAARGDAQPLRNYMNDCVLAARRGVVMVSPFISPKEKDVENVLLREHHPFIVLADNGFRDYYKPSALLFDAVAAGRVLILSPWPHDTEKRHISRDDCVALNAMAEEISSL